jgi:hypothetical protein
LVLTSSSTGSTNMIMVNSQHTLKLIEKCIAIKEDRISRCGNNEPWGYSIMCSALGLVETHLGIRTAEAAKAASAERFINLHYRMIAAQEPPALAGGAATLAGGFAAPPLARPTTPAMFSENERGRASSMMPPPSRERTRSITPFHFQGSQSSNPLDAPPTPFWTAGGELAVSADSCGDVGDVRADADSFDAFQMPMNPDHSLEALGIDLSEIWGESWDFFGNQTAMSS